MACFSKEIFAQSMVKGDARGKGDRGKTRKMRVVECQYLSSDLCFMMNLTGGEGGMSGERGE